MYAQTKTFQKRDRRVTRARGGVIKSESRRGLGTSFKASVHFVVALVGSSNCLSLLSKVK